MKVVINRCYGGFSLSPYGVARLAELRGKKAYFFKSKRIDAPGGGGYVYRPITLAEASNLGWGWIAVDEPAVPDPLPDEWYKEHDIDARDGSRSDPVLVQVVTELGGKANGSCASLAIVDVPDDVAWEIEEYDGLERVREVSRCWD